MIIGGLPVFLCPWKGGMSQGARDGGVTIPWKGGQIFAPRQLLLRCSTMLHPSNDAISAFPPSMVVICHKEPGMVVPGQEQLFIISN
jgi:hypothetical protein